jgi:hypothetical protein
MAHTTTVTAATAVAIADRINAEFQAGTLTTVNGREPASRYGATVATAWQNGTVSVSVRGRATGAPYCGPGQEWVHTHCESVWLQVGPGQQQDDNLGWFAAVVPVIALGVFLV